MKIFLDEQNTLFRFAMFSLQDFLYSCMSFSVLETMFWVLLQGAECFYSCNSSFMNIFTRETAVHV
jgi:hypothetical protein